MFDMTPRKQARSAFFFLILLGILLSIQALLENIGPGKTATATSVVTAVPTATEIWTIPKTNCNVSVDGKPAHKNTDTPSYNKLGRDTPMEVVCPDPISIGNVYFFYDNNSNRIEIPDERYPFRPSAKTLGVKGDNLSIFIYSKDGTGMDSYFFYFTD